MSTVHQFPHYPQTPILVGFCSNKSVHTCRSWKIYDFASNWTEKFTYLPQSYDLTGSLTRGSGPLFFILFEELDSNSIRIRTRTRIRTHKFQLKLIFYARDGRNVKFLIYLNSIRTRFLLDSNSIRTRFKKFTYLPQSYAPTGSLTRGSAFFLRPLWGQYLKHHTWLMPIRGQPAKKWDKKN